MHSSVTVSYTHLDVYKRQELGYIVNMMDKDTWDKSYISEQRNWSKQDAWKAQLIFAYTF